jgi:methionyl-tRNA formyltransferase
MIAKRIVFMGTPHFAVPSLEMLLSEGYEVVGVYTQQDKPAGRGRETTFSAVKKAALAYGLEIYQPDSLRNPSEVERLLGLRPDAIVVAAFGRILPADILTIPPLGCLNVHASLLPRHRGPSPIAAAILAGDEVSGVTIMLINEKIDAGPILSQRETAIFPEDTTGSLENRLAVIGGQLLMETLPKWQEGSLTPQLQDDGEATYSKRLEKEDGEIDWKLPATKLWQRVRALQPWPCCYTWWEGKRLRLIEVSPLPAGEGLEPGRVVDLKRSRAVMGVRCGEGILGISRLQLEGKRPLSAVEFLRGQRSFIGTQLPSERKRNQQPMREQESAG